LFLDNLPSHYFLGGIDATSLCQSIAYPYPASGGKSDTALQLTLQQFADILNGKSSFDKIKALSKFIPEENSLKRSTDVKTALTRMAEMEVDWLPVVRRTGGSAPGRSKFDGIVDGGTLTSTLVLAVVDALSTPATRRS